MSVEDPTVELLEKCPPIDFIREEMNTFKSRLGKLTILEVELKKIQSASDARFADAITLAIELEVGDEPPPSQNERGPKKPKGKTPAPRKPYNIYKSIDGIEIRVGRSASDNDELSCNPDHRDGPDWWLHVAGYAGSHVVIRSHEDSLPNVYKETITDAATLAAVYSKGPQSGRSAVSLVRCRQVSKPGGAKPGSVRLNGDIATVIVDPKLEVKRLQRLESTKNLES